MKRHYGKVTFSNGFPMSAPEVLAHLTQIARGDIGEFIDDRGQITLTGSTWLVKHYKKRGNTTTIELHSRLDALIMLAQYHGLITRYQSRRVNTATVNPILAETDVYFPNDFAK